MLTFNRWNQGCLQGFWVPQVKGEMPFTKMGKDRLVVVVGGVEIKGLVLTLCGSSNFVVPCAYDNADFHWTHTRAWNRQSLHFHPLGFPRCRWPLPQANSLLVYSTATWPMWPQLEQVSVPRASEECFLVCSTPPPGYNHCRETSPGTHSLGAIPYEDGKLPTAQAAWVAKSGVWQVQQVKKGFVRYLLPQLLFANVPP